MFLFQDNELDSLVGFKDFLDVLSLKGELLELVLDGLLADESKANLRFPLLAALGFLVLQCVNYYCECVCLVTLYLFYCLYRYQLYLRAFLFSDLQEELRVS